MASDIAEAISQQYLQNPPAGRYSELADADVIRTLFHATELGLNNLSACDAAGIDRTTFQRWSQRAELEPESAYASFARELKRLRRVGQLELLNRIKVASEKPQFWTAAAWTLERTDPEQFALRKDDAQVPKVVVNIGVSSVADVKVLIASGVTAATEEVNLSVGETVIESESVKTLTVGHSASVSR